jgi:NAD(P)-dependent dehydrogenase (short-subunit alcohol dehydrogenase family)
MRSGAEKKTACAPDLDGRVAIVTGGASGIGLATAELLSRRGASIALIDKSEPERDTRAFDAYTADVADEHAMRKAVDAIARKAGRIDILVNNAGIGARIPTERLSLSDWRQVLEVNLTGTFLGCREAGKHMLARGSGAIVNVGSIMGLVGNPLYPNLAYHATKGAIVNLTRALAVEWADRGVRVNAVAPTFVRTGLTERMLADASIEQGILRATPARRLAQPEEIADAITFLVSDHASMITGHTLPVDGGWLAQ